MITEIAAGLVIGVVLYVVLVMAGGKGVPFAIQKVAYILFTAGFIFTALVLLNRATSQSSREEAYSYVALTVAFGLSLLVDVVRRRRKST